MATATATRRSSAGGRVSRAMSTKRSSNGRNGRAVGPRIVRRRPTPIGPKFHGALDYATSAMVAAAPRMLDMPTSAKWLFEGLAAGYAGLSAVTNYPLSVKRLVPFKAHGAAELAIGALLPAAPWLLGFADNKAARNLCFALTGMTLVISALTDWNAED